MSYTFVDTFVYDGEEHEFVVNTVPPATVTYSVNGGSASTETPKRTNAGTDMVHFVASRSGFSTIDRDAEFTITPFVITDSMISWGSNEGCSIIGGTYTCEYSPDKQEPEVAIDAPLTASNTVRLVEGTDYDISYSVNLTGASYAVIVGKGNYTGRIVRRFNIQGGKILYSIYGDDLRLPSDPNTLAPKVTDTESPYYGQSELTGDSNGFAGYSYLTYSSVTGNGNIHFKTVPEQAVVKFGTTAGNYDLREIPRFKNAGEYTVYFKISLIDFEDITGSIKIIILPLELDTPYGEGELCHSGKSKAPI